MISPWPLGSKMGWDCFEVGNMYLLKQRAVPVGGKSHIHRKPQHIELVKAGFNPLPYVDLRFFPSIFSCKWGWSHQNTISTTHHTLTLIVKSSLSRSVERWVCHDRGCMASATRALRDSSKNPMIPGTKTPDGQTKIGHKLWANEASWLREILAR